MALLKTQKNELLKLIVEAKLSPTDFEWSPDGELLYYVGPGADGGEFFFRMAANSGPVDARPSSAPYMFTASAGVADTPWKRTLRVFRTWLKELRAEIEAPDLWSEL